jgi:hypothetical protein
MTTLRRSFVALTAPVILTVLGVAPLTAGLAPQAATAAPASPNPIQVTIQRLSPVAPQPGDTLVVAGTLTNTSDVSITGLAYELKISEAGVGSRSEFDSYADDQDGPLPQFGMVGAAPAVAATEQTLAPGASEPFRVTVDVDTLSELVDLGDIWQVRELGVSVSEVGDVVVGHLRTFLPWAPRDAAASNGVPTPVAWIWPLTDRPHRSSPTTWSDDALAPEIGTGGRLAGLLDAGNAAEDQASGRKHSRTQDVPVTWALDPMLVSDVKAMTTAYRVKSGSGTQAGAGTPAAKSWLAELRSAVTRPDAAVLPLPYGDPDDVAAVRAGFATLIGFATTFGQEVLKAALGTADLLPIGWPPGGLADQRTVNELRASGDTTVVLSDIAVPPVDGPPKATPTAHTEITTGDGAVDTVLTDSGLSNDADSGVNNPDGSRLSTQRFLAEALMIQREEPSVARDVVVAPYRRWTPSPAYAAQLLADTGKVPWIAPVSLSQVDDSPLDRTVQRAPLAYPDTARDNELSTGYLHRFRVLHNEIDDFSAILPQGGTGNNQIRAFTTAEYQTLSSGWRTQRVLASDQLSALRSSVSAAMQQVRITSHQGNYVTLTSHGGKVPVTVFNNLDVPVTITVQLKANQRLTFQQNGRKTVNVLAHQQSLVELTATAKTSGVFPLEVQLLTPGPQGRQYGPTIQLYVRSTVYGTITLAITGAAIAVLMVAVAIRLTRRALAARRPIAAAP